MRGKRGKRSVNCMRGVRAGFRISKEMNLKFVSNGMNVKHNADDALNGEERAETLRDLYEKTRALFQARKEAREAQRACGV